VLGEEVLQLTQGDSMGEVCEMSEISEMKHKSSSIVRTPKISRPSPVR
jgi:hypothetical protein